MADRLWTKSRRSSALASLLKPEGFIRRGADWELRRDDLRWVVFLSVVRRPDGDIWDVGVALFRVAEGQELEDQSVAQLGLSVLRGVEAQRAYRPGPLSTSDPMIRDVESVLLPLVRRHDTVLSVVQSMIDGEVVEFRPRDDCDLVHLLTGWRTARRLGYIAEVARAEGLLQTRDWDKRSRRYFKHWGHEWGTGLDLPRPSRPWRRAPRRRP